MKGDRKGGGGKGERQSLGEGRCQGSCNELGWQLEEKSSKGARWEKLSWENKQKKVMRRRKRETEQKTSWGWDDKNKTEGKKKENRNKKESIKRCYYVEKNLSEVKPITLCFSNLASVSVFLQFSSFHFTSLDSWQVGWQIYRCLSCLEKKNAISHTRTGSQSGRDCLVVSTVLNSCRHARGTSLIKHGRKWTPINNLYRSALSAFLKQWVGSRHTSRQTSIVATSQLVLVEINHKIGHGDNEKARLNHIVRAKMLVSPAGKWMNQSCNSISCMLIAAQEPRLHYKSQALKLSLVKGLAYQV